MTQLSATFVVVDIGWISTTNTAHANMQWQEFVIAPTLNALTATEPDTTARIPNALPRNSFNLATHAGRREPRARVRKGTQLKALASLS